MKLLGQKPDVPRLLPDRHNASGSRASGKDGGDAQRVETGCYGDNNPCPIPVMVDAQVASHADIKPTGDVSQIVGVAGNHDTAFRWAPVSLM